MTRQGIYSPGLVLTLQTSRSKHSKVIPHQLYKQPDTELVHLASLSRWRCLPVSVSVEAGLAQQVFSLSQQLSQDAKQKGAMV